MLCGQNAEVLNLKAGGTYSSHSTLKPKLLTFVCFLSRLSIESVPESKLPLSLPTHSNSSMQSSNCWFESLSWHRAFPVFTHDDLKREIPYHSSDCNVSIPD
jgi:hypothetical protein